MGKVVSGLFGGGDDAKKAAEQARRDQAVANDRQLAALQQADSRSGATRRNPRGRRLFTADAAAKTDLS